MPDVFLSYSRRNKRIVERIADDLREHHIDVWLDVLELEVGDLVHQKIERGIEESRYFCLAISPAALRSYYVLQVEFEAAFSRLVVQQRDDFILPILVQAITEPLPARLAGRFFLDFTKSRAYHKNLKGLVRKIKLQELKFTGQRWYKGLDISHFGEPVGVSELDRMPSLGGSYLITWEEGAVTRVDVYFNGKLANYKQFGYDTQGRVVENMMYSPDGAGGWHVVEDVWYYTYDEATGKRRTKFMKLLGAQSGREVSYNDVGQAVEENIISTGPSPDLSYGYTRKVFEYPKGGTVVRERWYDHNGDLVKTVERPS